MDRIRALLDLLANPGDLSYDELIAARNELADAFIEWDDAEATTPEGVELAVRADEVRATVDATLVDLEAQAEQRAATLAEIRERMAPAPEVEVDPPDPEPEPEPQPTEAESPETPEAEVEVEAIPETPAVEPIAATDRARTAVPLSVLNRTQPVSSRPRGEVELAGAPIMTAAPDTSKFAAGARIDWTQAAEIMCERLDSARLADDGAAPTKMRAGRLSWAHQFDEPRTMHAGDSEGNERKITGVVGDYPGDTRVLTPRDGSGLTASGGLCAPVTVRYELETVTVADRPLRDALPSFNADRGGIQFNSPAHLVDILADTTNAALTTTTVANDASATTKTVQEVACGTLQTVNVRAIAERLQFSNFADRYNPERMRQWMQLARGAHSRLAERELLEDIRAASTLVLGGTLDVGAARYWIGNMYAAAEGQRYRHRMSEDYPIRVIIPDWFATVVEIDVLKQAPGDGVIDSPVEGRGWISRWLGQENIRPIFQRDDARTNNALGAGAPGFTAQSGSGASLQDFAGRLESIMFPEGSFLFLDGGTLDFGIIRDSTLNAQNRFQTFYEVFEGVAFVGVESLDIVTPICASGTAAALVTTKCGGVGS